MLMFTSVPLAFFAEELKAILDGADPIVGILVFGIVMVLNAFAFGMTIRGLWKEWKGGRF